MSVKKTWSVKLFPLEKDHIVNYLKEMITSDDLLTSPREALLKIFSNLDESPEVLPVSSSRDLSEFCELNFLQRLVDPKDSNLKWFCLRASRPDRKGKPILMGDGRDEPTIEKLCQGCRDGWIWAEKQKLSLDQIEAIKRFGDQEIEAHIFACNHAEVEYVQISPNPRKAFSCFLTGRLEVIEKKCIRDPCPHLFRVTFPVSIKDSPAYEELQKQLEEKPK